MWLKLPNGRDELVINEDHIKRLKDDGAIEIADPRLPSQEPPTEQTLSPELDAISDNSSTKSTKSKSRFEV